MKHKWSHSLLRLLVAAAVLMTAFPSSGRAFSTEVHRPASIPPQNPPALTTTGSTIEIRADSLGLPLSDHEVAMGYEKPSVFLETGSTVRFEVSLETEGLYTVSFDMAAAESFINKPEGQLTGNGGFPLDDLRRIVFPIFYESTEETFPLDRYGNETLTRQERLYRWTKVPIRDADFSLKYPLHFPLTPGTHTFEFTITEESLFLGSIYVEEFSAPPAYSEYIRSIQAPESTGVLIELEAERPSFKNDTSVRPANSRSLDVSPYDTYRLLMNTLGGDSWKVSGSTAYYEFTVPQDGLYMITLRALQDTRNNFTTFRRITINDTAIFDELHEVPFNYSPQWSNITLGGETPYLFYLKAGENVLGIEANNSPYDQAIEKIKKVLLDINTLSLEVKKLTGNQVDVYKEWVITDYIPDIEDRLIAIAGDLSADKDVLEAVNQTGGSHEVMTYQMAIDSILFLAEEPDKIPTRLNRFSEGTGSAAQLLASILPSLQNQPLALDKIYIHSPDTPPQEVEVPFYTPIVDWLKRFFHSFKPNPYQSTIAEEDELEIWVNRPRQYVDLLQKLADETFTKETGIRTKFSIMPQESKLVLANAAGIQPDIALGVSTNIPYELAIRNALTDLRSFDDFDSYIGIYSPGSLLSYIINDSVYAIPETQDFWVTFYRKDIMDSLGLPIPRTWEEVIEILPELQRYGMNFNTPLSSGSGSKGFLITAPYIFNYDAKLYGEDGFSTGLNSEEGIAAMKFMAESFTIYGMPLTTSNFYDSFRVGALPIGVSNFETYLKLMTAAPEIAGLWGIDLYPATVLPDGTQNRYATGSAQASIMFANTERPDDSWEFLKWWMSTETQVDFQQQLVLNYGLEYLWNSANLEAFQYLPIPEEHREVILEQWQWIQEPVRLPGSYMVERELSNAWNAIVFDGVHPRVAIDTSTIIINREITRKMEEFGFLVNGVKVKEYKIPTIDTVREWIENGR